MTKKGKIVLFIIVAFFILSGVCFLAFGINLLESTNPKVKRAGIMALKARVSLSLFDADTLAYAIDADIKHLMDSCVGVQDIVGKAYYQLSLHQRKLFHDKMGQLLLSNSFWNYPEGHYPYAIYSFYGFHLDAKETRKLDLDILKRGIASESRDLQFASWAFIVDRFKDNALTKTELDLLCQDTFDKGLQEKNGGKVIETLSVVWRCKLTNFAKAEKDRLATLSESSANPKVRMFSKACLDLVK